MTSTQAGFGALLNELGREQNASSQTRIVTTSPDVTVSTNLGPWVNRRGLFAREKLGRHFRSERIPSTFNWDFSPKGQHIELGIAEMNLFILLSALGLSHAINGERLIPIGTLYDPFIRAGSMRSTMPVIRMRASFWWRRRPASRSRPRGARISRSPRR